MARVRKPGGSLAVIDLLAPEDRVLTQKYNHYETLRDPSHTRALTDTEFASLFWNQGLELSGKKLKIVEVSVENWLDLTDADSTVRKTIVAALEAELDGGEQTGMNPCVRDGKLFFNQLWGIYLSTIR